MQVVDLVSVLNIILGAILGYSYSLFKYYQDGFFVSSQERAEWRITVLKSLGVYVFCMFIGYTCGIDIFTTSIREILMQYNSMMMTIVFLILAFLYFSPQFVKWKLKKGQHTVDEKHRLLGALASTGILSGFLISILVHYLLLDTAGLMASLIFLFYSVFVIYSYVSAMKKGEEECYIYFSNFVRIKASIISYNSIGILVVDENRNRTFFKYNDIYKITQIIHRDC